MSQVRVEVGKILNKDAALIDVSMPLLKQGADELDIVEVVMAVEEVFGVVIPDGELEEKGDEPIKNLNINKIAQAVAKQKKGK